MSKFKSTIDAPTIGIDLGTTYSCISVYQNGKCQIIPIDNENTMASYVSFTDEGRIIGNTAKENVVYNPTNTISDVKRYIGCRYSYPELQKNLKNYLYEIINDNDSPKIKIVHDLDETLFAPEEISAMILTKLKHCAEEYFQKSVCKAVITVPANFKDSQRQATMDAARIAGLDPKRIINEPTAAALAFQVREKYKNDTTEKTILVYDFGGGTFDVSIINLDNDILDVRATFGDNYLGGNDIDECLVRHFKRKYEDESKNSLDNPRDMRRLRARCEKVKIKLSSAENATIELDQLSNGRDFYDAITRKEFEVICRPVIQRTITLIKQVLHDAGVEKSEIDDILLVGGSSRIPLVRTLLKEFFDGKELNTSLDADLAVAMGAAIQASILDGADDLTIGSLLLLDVTSLSLGLETSGGLMTTIIKRNSPIPTRITKKFTNEKDLQTKVKIIVYEGERSMVEDNNKLGEFMMCGITPKPRGECLLEITYDINTDGVLNVIAEEKTTGKTNNILDVTVDKGRLSEVEIRKMIETAKKMEREDKIKQETVLARIALESFCIDTKHKANKYVSEKGDCYKIIEKCDEILNWLKNNTSQGKGIYETKKSELNNFIRPIIIKYM